jgi:hypothetical protein
MTQELKPRVMRVDDFVAELLEKLAASIPPSQKTQTDIWLSAANEL